MQEPVELHQPHWRSAKWLMQTGQPSAVYTALQSKLIENAEKMKNIFGQCVTVMTRRYSTASIQFLE